VNFIMGGPIGSSKTVVAPEGETITFAEAPVKKGVTYVRVEVVDEQGRKAWTNAVRLDGNASEDSRLEKLRRLRYGMKEESSLIYEEMLEAMEREEALAKRLKQLEKKQGSVHCRKRQLKDYLE